MRKRGFTLIELLVVVAIIGLLMAILIPALGKARETARRATCAANLKAIAESTVVYANQWNNSIPLQTDIRGVYLWDVSALTTSALFSGPTSNSKDPTSQRRFFYCPSDYLQNVTALWNWAVTTNTANPPVTTGIRVLGYFWLGKRVSNAAGAAENPQFSAFPTNFKNRQNPLETDMITKIPQPGGIGGPMNNDSDVELVMDTIVADHSTPVNYENINLQPSGGYQSNNTNHLSSSGQPAGANVAAIDGHVEWRPYVAAKVMNFKGSAMDCYMLNR